jgi:mono/diheme cytochrome c family protein
VTKPRILRICCGVAVVVLATPSFARADAANGERLANQWCANCHVVGSGSPSTIQQGPPSFRSVAQTVPPDQLRAFLTKPHGAMPDLSLTRAEIDDLIGYIEKLR